MMLEPIIGLEIHVQLRTKSKMFCRCDNRGEDAPPNTTVCPICMGHPGTLPVANKQAIGWAVKTALALDFTVAEHSKFDRKSYFYPDLPKGYQISQYDEPIGKDGSLTITVDGKERTISFERLHLEEDAAKLLHVGKESSVDFNRVGTPLLEIVTKPDLRSPAEAKKLLQELRLIMRYLKVSDADMEKGHLRCDANISLRPTGEHKMYPKTEIKNLNSFRSVERALAFETERQTKLWEEGSAPNELSTRGWDEVKVVTVEKRTKETAQDYRYFPEPDLPPLRLTTKWLAEIRQRLKEIELPSVKRERFRGSYGLDIGIIGTLIDDRAIADFFEEAVRIRLKMILERGEHDASLEEVEGKHRPSVARRVANWLTSKYFEVLNAERKLFGASPVTPEQFADLLSLLEGRQLNSTAAVSVLHSMVLTGNSPRAIVEKGDLGQVGDTNVLSEIVQTVIRENEKVVNDYRKGKAQSIQVLVGQVMKKTKGRADPQVARKLLEDRLKS